MISIRKFKKGSLAILKKVASFGEIFKKSIDFIILLYRIFLFLRTILNVVLPKLPWSANPWVF